MMQTIERDELIASLDSDEPVTLVMALDRIAFETAHIPGSIHLDVNGDALNSIDAESNIVVYCSDPACVASQLAYQTLKAQGFANVWRYAGGLSDWASAGRVLEGTQP